MPVCKSCNDNVSWLYFDKAEGICFSCRERIAPHPVQSQPVEDFAYRKVIATTGLTIPNREILEIVDVISAEAAMGVNVFRDIAASLRDAFGGRSQSLQQVMKQARQTCMDELRKEAHAIGADAIVAVDLGYSEYSSSLVGGGMLLVTATGTAVRLSHLPA